jgi:hypothetical protein
MKDCIIKKVTGHVKETGAVYSADEGRRTPALLGLLELTSVTGGGRRRSLGSLRANLSH